MTRDELIENNIGLVSYVINTRFYVDVRNGLYEDLYGAGCIGLCRAADTYEDGKGRFSTYACRWIDIEIRAYKRDNAYFLHVPVHHRRRLTDEDISTLTTLSIDAERELVFQIPDNVDVADDAIVQVAIDDALSKLTPRAREVMKVRLKHERHLDAAKELGISTEAVRQVVERFRKHLNV